MGELSAPDNLASKPALVRFASVEEATRAKDSMNGLQPLGFLEPLQIKFANAPPSWSGGGGWGDGGKSEGWGQDKSWTDAPPEAGAATPSWGQDKKWTDAPQEAAASAPAWGQDKSWTDVP